MDLKSAQIVDLCGKSSGFADFENIVDRGSAVIFDADYGLCLSEVQILGPKQNWDHRSFFSLDWYVNEFMQIIYFSKEVHCTRVFIVCYWNCTVLLSSACCLLYLSCMDRRICILYPFFTPLLEIQT